MNDTLSYMRQDRLHRRYHQQPSSPSASSTLHRETMLPLSHHERGARKGFLLGKIRDAWQKFANVRLLLTTNSPHPAEADFMATNWHRAGSAHRVSSTGDCSHLTWHRRRADDAAGRPSSRLREQLGAA